MVAIRFEHAPSQTYRYHPAAEIFPWIEGQQEGELREDIQANGVLEPIVFLDDQILDGRNRYMIARELGMQYPRVEYDGDDPVGFVISRNLLRRHLTDNQRAMMAAKLAKMPRGRPASHNPPIGGLSVAGAAERFGVAERTVQRAKVVDEHGAPELASAVNDGIVSIDAAASVASLPVSEQQEIVARGETAILAAAKDINARKAARSRERRLEKIAVTAESGKVKTAGGIPRGFAVIYADPPWENEVYSEETGAHKSPLYPTMPLADICALCAGGNTPATDDAVLFLWTTGNRVHHGLQVMDAWGFEFKTTMIWDKVTIGMGRWVRDRHEILLIGTRGSIPAPLPGSQAASVYAEAKGQHSAKPGYFRDVIESYYPGMAKLELFAIGQHAGWVSWGYGA